jgi:4a-hydroxytetrahydrobiopterin dehydratase
MGFWERHKEKAMNQWRDKGSDDTYSDDEIEVRLSEELPYWHFENGCIQRRYQTAGWKATMMLVNTVGHLAEAAFHHPDIGVSYSLVVVKLSTHSANGVTAKDFELAKKIEDVLMWRPGLDPESALEGPPEEPRFQYLKYDD